MQATAPPSLADQARLIDDGKVRVVSVAAAPNGYHCYAGCPRWMGCDCPPHQYISQRPRGRR